MKTKFMKKMKLAVVMAALTASLGFTSCLDNDGPSEYQVSGILKVKSNMGMDYFEAVDGTKYMPTQPVTIKGTASQFASVYFSYNYDQFVSEGNEKTITVLGTPEYVKRGDSTIGVKSDKCVSIREIKQLDSYGAKGTIWATNEYLFLYPQFSVHKDTEVENLQTELGKHVFTLYYDENEQEDNGCLNLTLGYTVYGADTDEALKEYNKSYYCPIYFDLQTLVNKYEGKYGKYPEKLKLEYHYSTEQTPNCFDGVNDDKMQQTEFTMSLIKKSETGK